mmetsp:Transcript_26889/g.69000  ORF Transcript_26889/g.69000 Transcript_26889/m.69000 type:complete len:318 (-) Transcript_26889:18-971(-)
MAGLQVTQAALLDCCHSEAFANGVLQRGAITGVDALLAAARSVWWNEVPVTGWLEAFAAHPRIGDVEGLKRKFGAFAEMSKGEQALAADTGDDAVFQELLDWNRKYEAKFGHIFIVFATGKTAAQMLALLKARFPNPPHVELTIAATEQMKITELRIGKTWGSSPAAAAGRRAGQVLRHLTVAAPGKLVSPITTHVLDTTAGRPAEALTITLFRKAPGTVGRGEVWEEVSTRATNKDGRIPDLMEPSDYCEPGQYRLTFQTGAYQFEMNRKHPAVYTMPPFYPTASIDFEIAPHQAHEHFHVPLLFNPFGYSTYRGS